jgi:CelD/BcsL family acetyltransferase involved in cellulose biosynthesis
VVTIDLIDDLRTLLSLESDWDELAVDSGSPYCSPVWMLAWWRRVAAPGSRLRVVIVRDGRHLIGIAPFFVDNGPAGLARYRLLGSGTAAPIQPLARPGGAETVADFVASAIATADPPPDLVTLEGVPARSRWPSLLAGGWPGRSKPWLHRDMSLVAPFLTLSAPSYETWLGSKSSNFRQQMGRFRRRLTKRGATLLVADTRQELAKGLDNFVRLHRSRWDSRGGSNALEPGVEEMLRDVASDSSGSLRMRLWSMEVDGHAISTQIFVAAGGELAYWNGGFDEAWSSERPSLQTILAAIEQAWSVGDRRVDFGGGGHDYKYRFADGEEVLEWVTLVPSGRRSPLVRLLLAPDHLRRLVTTRLSYETKLKLKQRLHETIRLHERALRRSRR